MKKLIHFSLMLICLWAIESCAPAVTSSISKTYPSLSATESVFVYGLNDNLPSGYEVLGNIKIGDTGFSTGCSFDAVVQTAQNKARNVGGNAIKIMSIREPDMSSTCYRITAAVLKLQTLDKSKLRKIITTETELTKYFDQNKSTLESIEGIWNFTQLVTVKASGEKRLIQNVYEIAIAKRDFSNSRKFDAIIISSQDKDWNELGLVKAEFTSTAYNDIYTVSWINANGSSNSSTFTINKNGICEGVFDDNAYTTEITMIKTYPKFDGSDAKKSSGGVSGTGFAIYKEGIIATNYHVIEDAKKIELTFTYANNDKKTFIANVILKDKSNDIALLKIEDARFTGFKAIPYSIESNCKTGEQVFTIGYPMNDVMGTNYKLTQGVLSSTTGIKDDARYLQITAPVQPGNSGGPLFNSKGNVIGITSAKLNGSAIGVSIENVNYAIKSDYLNLLIDMLPDKEKPKGTGELENKKFVDQVEILKDYVCLISVTF